MTEPQTVGDLVDALPPVPAPRPIEERGAVTPMRMLQIAIEKNANLDMLERLMGLNEKWEAAQARKAFVEALAAFKINPPTVLKNKAASFGAGKTAYEYANLAQVCAVIAPALSRHGLSHRWEVEQADGLIRVTTILTHAHGHSERLTLQAGADTSGSKNAIQAVGSTISYLERYGLLGVTGLAAGDQDDDGGVAGQAISAEQKEELVALMKETGADTKRFLDYLRIETLDELPASAFANAKAALAKKKAAPAPTGKAS